MHTPPDPDVWRTVLEQSTIPGLPNLNRTTVAGIAVAISGNILISLALNCQKLAHRRLERERELKRVSGNGDEHSAPQNGHGVKGNTEDDSSQTLQDGESSSSIRYSLAQNVDHTQETEAVSASAVSETQPLLTHSNGISLMEDSGLRHQKRSLLARIFPWARQSDHAHLSSVHSLMPVDVVAVSPGSASEENSNKRCEEDNRANESDYLKSKLWCDFTARALWCH